MCWYHFFIVRNRQWFPIGGNFICWWLGHNNFIHILPVYYYISVFIKPQWKNARCWHDAGPMSQTVTPHQASIGSTYCVCCIHESHSCRAAIPWDLYWGKTEAQVDLENKSQGKGHGISKHQPWKVWMWNVYKTCQFRFSFRIVSTDSTCMIDIVYFSK